MSDSTLHIPRRLVIDLRTSPVSLALYTIIGALWTIDQQAIPLSREDVRRYDPQLRVGAVQRAFNHLLRDSWLVSQRTFKNYYVPTWGRIRSQVIPWQANAPRYGCPDHVETIVVDPIILEATIGKLTPCAKLPAIIDQGNPSGHLSDIGRHLLQIAGLQ